MHSCQLREGHPEGYVLAFANLYRDLADQIMAAKLGQQPAENTLAVPDVSAGVQTMRFFDAAVRSSENGRRWQEL
jgi:hypothetical protein